MLLIYLFISHQGLEDDKEPIAAIADHKDVGGHIVANLPVYFSSRCIERQRTHSSHCRSQRCRWSVVTLLLIYLFVSHQGVEEHKEPIAAIGDHKDVGGLIVANIPVCFSSRCRGGQRDHSCHYRSRRCRWSQCCCWQYTL